MTLPQPTTIELPKDLIASLIESFQRLQCENDKTLPSDLVQFIQDGNDQQTIATRIQNQRGFGSLLRTYGSGNQPRGSLKESRSNWLQRDDVSPLFFRRLAFVLRLSMLSDSQELSQRFPTAYCLFGEWSNCLGYGSLVEVSIFRRWLNADMPDAPVDDSSLVDLLFESFGKTSEYVLRYHMNSVTYWLPILNEHSAKIDAFIGSRPASEQVQMIKYLNKQGYNFAPHFPAFAKALANSSSRELRTAIVTHLRTDSAKTIPLFQGLLGEKTASVRKNTIEALFELDSETAKEIATKHLSIEKSAGLIEVIGNLLALHATNVSKEQDPVDSGTQGESIDIELGEVPISDEVWSNFASRLTEFEVKEKRTFVADRQSDSTATAEEILARWPRGESYHSRLSDLRQTMEKGVVFTRKVETNYYWDLINGVFNFLAMEPRVDGIRLIHVFRLYYFGNPVRIWGFRPLPQAVERYLPNELAIRPAFSLAHIACVEGSMPDCSVPKVLQSYLESIGREGVAFGMDVEQIWPVYFAHPQAIHDLLQQAISGSASDLNTDSMRGAASVLTYFPSFTSDLANLLWQYALGEKKQVRKELQKVLDSQSDFVARLRSALTSKQGSTREAAYLWLARRKLADLKDDLEDAFRRERSEPLKVLALKALEAIGAQLGKLLDRNSLISEAEAGIKKARNQVEWLPWKELPLVRWSDSGEEVPKTIVRWWILQAVALKSAVASPLLRLWLDQCNAQEVEALAKWLIAKWIEVALKSGKSLLPDKGMLAIPGCLCSNDILTMAHAYLKEFYGWQIGECRALLEMASGSERPEALHFLKKISQGFRTKSIQTHAQKLIEEAAEQREWTPSEFADRVIPDGGFVLADADSPAHTALPAFAKGHPTLELDYGGRTIYAILNDELECLVVNSDGKSLKKLPDSIKSDDAGKVALAKKQFSAGKKAVKDVIAVEAHRLFEAMCVERAWRAQDWQSFLQRHAILGKLVQRIVWTAWASESESEKTLLASFRPLADRTLVTNSDETFSLPDDSLVQVGNGLDLSLDDIKRWATHLEDYEVIPLLRQFNTPMQFSPEQLEQTAIDQFLGHRIEYFKFKRLAEKLGYQRGPSGDGGRFFHFKKSIASVSLEVTLEFSGNVLPEQPGLIALQQIQFFRKRANEVHAYGNAVQLKRVPRLLLSECFIDLQELSKAGIGYSEDWQTGLVL